jgi:hypothetical protein
VKEIFSRLHPDRNEGLEDLGFPPPRDYKPVAICRFTGKLADSNTPYVSVDYFKPGAEPTEYSDVRKLMAIDKRNNLLASPSCPKKYVVYKNFVILPTIFKDWAMAQGLPAPPANYSPLCGDLRIIDNYQLTITSPRDDSRFYLDPEMPAEVFYLNCLVEPARKTCCGWSTEKSFELSFSLQSELADATGEIQFPGGCAIHHFKDEVIRVEIF